MSDSKDIFRQAISVTFDHWPSFQIAVRDGMGGPNTAAKLEWMCDMLAQLFDENDGDTITVDDVVDYVSEVIDNEFDTIIQDGSTEMVCTNIVAYFRRIRAGDVQFVIDKLESLKRKQAELSDAEQQRNNEQTRPPQSSHATDDMTTTADDNNEPKDDGWTVVRRKK